MHTRPDGSSVPDWAIAQASAALKVGQTVPQIENQLIAKGLSAIVATAAVNAALEGGLQESSTPEESNDDALLAHRVASFVAVVICLGLAYAYNEGESVARTFLWLMLPVASIWWAEVLTDVSPPRFVRRTAWLVVLLIAGYRVVLLLQ